LLWGWFRFPFAETLTAGVPFVSVRICSALLLQLLLTAAMVRVLFNTDDHHAHTVGSRGSAAAVPSTVDDSSVLGSHRCRVFDMHALLTEPRWLGTRALLLELTTSTLEAMSSFCVRLRAALRGVVTARIRVLSPCQLRLSRIDIRSAAVDAALLLPLAEFILSVEVEKEPNWRAGALPGHAASAASQAAAASSSSSTSLQVSPFDPASITGPTHPTGAALCCTVLRTRVDYVAALSAEITAAVRGQKALQALKAAGGAAATGSGGAEQMQREDAAATEIATKHLAEQDAAAVAAVPATAATPAAVAADDADDASPQPTDVFGVGVKRTCPSLASRVRTQFARLEAHRQRLVQLLKSDLPVVSAMHTCNVCQRVLRVEAEGPAPSSSSVNSSVASGKDAQQAIRGSASAAGISSTVTEAELARMYEELALTARAGGQVDSSAAAQAAAATAAAAAVAAAYSNAATGAASSAQFAVPLTAEERSGSAPGSAPLLTPAQARLRLAELQTKLKAASGAEAKARRKKIAKKISELRAKYALVLHGGGEGLENADEDEGGELI
jgi:hypothetical protein